MGLIGSASGDFELPYKIAKSINGGSTVGEREQS